MTWQPIETAPKDETWVLGYDRTWKEVSYTEDEPHCCVVVQWLHGEWVSFYTSGPSPDPSHWMPLPEPPQTESE